ncbi:MAG: ATP-binding protein [Candidatus Thermoplasmatota archaeon]
MSFTSALRTGAGPPKPGVAKGGADDATQEYRRLFQANPTPLIVVEHDTLHVAAVNAAATRAFGHSEAEFLASSLVDFLEAPDREALLATPNRLPVPGLLDARSSWKIACRDGDRLRIEVAGGAPLVFHGKPCALLFQPPAAEPTARDVRLDGVDLTEFSFSALHDLKEPLHLVKGYLALLRAGGAGALDAESRDFLENAYSGTQRMQALVLNLLEYFRADAKGIAPEPVDLDGVLAETLEGLRLQIKESQAVVTHDALPPVMADRVQIGRVLQNLLSNAVKFRSANPPRVHVSAHRSGKEWEVVVKDDGIGIAAKDIDRVLKPFQRAHSVDRFPGTGLGLSISKKIVELHGGRLWLVSGLGEGTEVHFTLPAQGA